MSKTLTFPNCEDIIIRKAIQDYQAFDYENSAKRFQQAYDSYSNHRDFIRRVVYLFLEVDLIDEALSLLECYDLYSTVNASDGESKAEDEQENLPFSKRLIHEIYQDYKAKDKWFPTRIQNWISGHVVVEWLDESLMTVIIPQYESKFENIESMRRKLNEGNQNRTYFYGLMYRILQKDYLTIAERVEFHEQIQDNFMDLDSSHWRRLIESITSPVFRSDILTVYIERVKAPLKVTLTNWLNEPVEINLGELEPLRESDITLEGMMYIYQTYGENLELTKELVATWIMFQSTVYPFFNDLKMSPTDVIKYLNQTLYRHFKVSDLSEKQNQQLTAILEAIYDLELENEADS